MPHRKKPIKQRPKVDDESIGRPREFHGKHREDDEALPGRGSTKGGLNRQSETRGSKQSERTPHHERERDRIGRPRSESGEPGGGAGRRDEDVGGSGVYPASGRERPEGAEIRSTGEWGQKLGGTVGGASELNPYDLGLTDRELDKAD